MIELILHKKSIQIDETLLNVKEHLEKFYSNKEQDTIAKTLESFYLPIYKEVYQKREYKAGKQSQAEAHEAIRITHPHKYEDLESIVYNASITNQDALKLYRLIFERTIESQGRMPFMTSKICSLKSKMSILNVLLRV